MSLDVLTSPVVLSMLNGILLDGVLFEASIEYVMGPYLLESASSAIAFKTYTQ